MVTESRSAVIRRALDGARRRRLFLFRHGSVDYMDTQGNWVPDPDVVSLNGRGRQQAKDMSRLFDNVHVDKAVCSGLPRTRQTATVVLGDRDLELEIVPNFEEIRPMSEEAAGGYDVFAEVAYSHWRAPDYDARFLGGERYDEFYTRVVAAMQSLLDDQDWDDLAVFAHGGTNAAVLGWITGLGLAAFGILDQQTCCLNIADFDCDKETGRVLRKTLRAMNITADDPVKASRHSGDMELLAGMLLKNRTAG